ncbi:hypothetical protein ES288_D06G026600v1 [Gossypium darwinii]|uniref:LOB domain-containing protein n=1 Tax=Gossypium darwinii TaxID=34276 RepID=A0A5D2C4V4_GOSDA|nr:hypothetical protein ES288_D06G026600v1 [Gossypium darwinii]
MAAEFYEKDAARHVCYDLVYGGLNRLKLKATLPCFSLSFLAGVISFRLSPPSLNLNVPSLLFEACGRTVNPVNGAVGLLSSGNWHICQAALETVLQGGALRPISAGSWTPSCDESSDRFCVNSCNFESKPLTTTVMMTGNQSVLTAPSDLSLSVTAKLGGEMRTKTVSFYSEESEITTLGSNGNEETQDTKILNLFV